MTELGEPAKRLLHLFERASAVRFLRQPFIEEQPHVAVRDTDWRSQLVRKHMQDVAEINGHAKHASMADPLGEVRGSVGSATPLRIEHVERTTPACTRAAAIR